MQHEIHSITSFTITGPYTLDVIFENSRRKRIDFSPILHGEMYAPLKEPDFFNRVRLDDEVNTLVWPNGADFDPSLLYHWDENIEELSCRAKEWTA